MSNRIYKESFFNNKYSSDGMKKYTAKTPPSNKYWWVKNQEHFAAGGILFLDTVDGERGLWVLEEISRKNRDVECSDFGGRYHYDDGDIYATIAREFREETMNTCEISYSKVKELCQQPDSPDKFVFKIKRGKYYCLIVDIKYFPLLKFDNLDIINKKKEIQIENRLNKCFYRSVGVKFIPFSKIHLINKSYRLNDIILNSQLKKYIK